MQEYHLECALHTYTRLYEFRIDWFFFFFFFLICLQYLFRRTRRLFIVSIPAQLYLWRLTCRETSSGGVARIEIGVEANLMISHELSHVVEAVTGDAKNATRAGAGVKLWKRGHRVVEQQQLAQALTSRLDTFSSINMQICPTLIIRKPRALFDVVGHNQLLPVVCSSNATRDKTR